MVLLICLLVSTTGLPMSLHAYHVHWKILSVICLNFGGSSFADKPNFNASTLIFLLWLLHSSSSSRILLLSHFSDTTSNSHVRLCNPMDCSLSSSSVHRILQARILEWTAMPSSRGSLCICI